MKHLIRLEKYPDIGEGHITLAPFSPDSIGQGTWTFLPNTSVCYNMECYNLSHTNGDNATFKVMMARGTYTFKLMHGTGSNRPILKIQVDGVTVQTVDLYSAGNVHNLVNTQANIIIAATGIKNITYLVDGKNGASSDYYALTTVIQMYRTA